jgi:hydroxyacylglutathione hydrolase
MIKIHKLTYNPFSENMYILSDETNECVIIDPGCYSSEERADLKNYIEENDLKPVALWNTHCHLDHVFGNSFVAKEWGLELGIHALDLPTLNAFPMAAKMYGIDGIQLSPEPSYFISEGDKLRFGNSELEVLFGPGHAPGHIAFYSLKEMFIINGDILFQGSYGRYDLPGGDFDVLKQTITEKMFSLPEEMVVYTGHGGETTIGAEKQSNPILF